MLQVENEVIERLVARIKKEEIPRYGSWHNFAAQSRRKGHCGHCHWPVYKCNATLLNRISMFPQVFYKNKSYSHTQDTLNMQASNECVQTSAEWPENSLDGCRSQLERWWKVRSSQKAAAREEKSSQSSGTKSGAAGRWAAHHGEFWLPTQCFKAIIWSNDF